MTHLSDRFIAALARCVRRRRTSRVELEARRLVRHLCDSRELLPENRRTAHESGQFFLTLEIAAKLNLPALVEMQSQLLPRLPSSLREDATADWEQWPMRVKPAPAHVSQQ